MAFRTDFLGILLILLGIISYFVTGMVSITALIPAFFGIVFVILALIANSKPNWKQHIMHASVLLAIIGIIPTIGSVFDLIGGATASSVIAKAVMALLLIIYLIMAIKSFIAARK